MARTATLTVSQNTNRDTMHIGPFVAVLSIANRQTVRTGKATDIRAFIAQARKDAGKFNVSVKVVNDTAGKFTA